MIGVDTDYVRLLVFHHRKSRLLFKTWQGKTAWHFPRAAGRLGLGCSVYIDDLVGLRVYPSPGRGKGEVGFLGQTLGVEHFCTRFPAQQLNPLCFLLSTSPPSWILTIALQQAIISFTLNNSPLTLSISASSY